jgi:hypothetical protein
MNDILRDLLIGISGSVIGAMLVYFGQIGVTVGRKARDERDKRRQKEIALWNTRKIQVRLAITYSYLFDLLKYFLMGTIVASVPGLFSIFGILRISYQILAIVSTIFAVLALGFFMVGLGRAGRYLALRKQDDEYLDSYLKED